ncbi:oral-facial-digital syndrome 1 protein homolog isoform X2 [Anneissia japonica]|uniref:oral-facial-digital syndrome 1 protein homolog isoform X2 n=1 Tax=Anneissia japonica TaxID=1529436 RepID=UPI0014259131|nr:oral-facial-digital syndrome 1 protein homolog isoform X2 [Anneissia japonica]
MKYSVGRNIMEEGELSSEEFKSRLYQSFREKGYISNLKSQLRSKLIVELKNTALNQDFPKAAVPLEEEDSLLHRASNSLVADHLQRCQYEYSLAVFLPESGVASDKLFTTRDLLQLLKINPDSKLYRKIASSLPSFNAKGLLWQLLSEIANSHSGGSESKGVQADLYSHSSLVDKLDDVDRAFNSRSNGQDLQGSNVITEKMLSFQREVEARSKEQLNFEIRRFKESEYRSLQMEEREKFRLKLESSRKDLENTYQMRCRALEERERNATERLQQQQQIAQKEMHAQRQNLLDELQILRSKEAEVRRESEVNKRAAKLEEDKRLAIEENLKLREIAVNNIEENYQQRLKEQLTQYALQKRKEYSDRLDDVERRERRVRDEARKLEEESQMNKEIKQEMKEKKTRIEELQNLLQCAKNDLLSSNKSNEIQQEKLRDMVDYQQMKESNAVMRRELETTKMRLAETINEYKTELARQDERMQLLSAKASLPSPELVSMKAEVHRARDRVKQEKALMESRETQLKSRLQNEADRNRELQRQLDEQTLQMKEMNRELSELRAALQQTQTALSNEVYRKPSKPAHFAVLGKDVPVHDRSAGHQTRPMVSSTDFDDGYLPIGGAVSGHQREPFFDDDIQFESAPARDSSPSPDTSLAFLENTRERFRSLEREAENLEQSYKNFQHRMTNPIALRTSPKPVKRGLVQGSAFLSPATDLMMTSHSESYPRPDYSAGAELLQDGLTRRYQGRKHGGVSLTSHVAENSSTTYSNTGAHRRLGQHELYSLRATHDSTVENGMSHQRSSTHPGHRNVHIPGMSSTLDDPAVRANSLQPISQQITQANLDRNIVDDSPSSGFVHGTSEVLGREEPRGDGGYYDSGTEASAVQALGAIQRVSEPFRDELQYANSEPISDQHESAVSEPISDQHQHAVSKPTNDQPLHTVSLDNAWTASPEVAVPSLDGAWKTPADAQPISLDTSWKTSEQLAKDEEKRIQEEKEWEENRKRRMEERRRNEEEARERERRTLEELEKKEAGGLSGHQGASPDHPEASPGSDETVKEQKEVKKDDKKEETAEDASIDPVMQQYMKIVQEKQTQKKQKGTMSPTLNRRHETYVFDNTDVADYVEYADVKSTGEVSDTSDPFADW